MADRGPNLGLRWAAGIALVAVGATTLYDRVKGVRRPGAAGAMSTTEFAVGRGAPRGPVDRVSRQAGYELADTDVRTLFIVLVVSIIIMVAGVAGVFAMYSSFDHHFAAEIAPETAQQRQVIVPPLPHLQADPYKDIDATLTGQARRLTTYGWNGPDHASAHIPIERAMRQVVGKPLDATAAADASGPAGTEAAMPAPSALNAETTQDKPANQVQGEGRPGAVAPSYDPKQDDPKQDRSK